MKKDDQKAPGVIGEALRQAREARGETIDSIAARIHVPSRHLQALECEAWNYLPQRVYTLGFLRCYAAELGLDAEALVAVYRGPGSEERRLKAKLKYNHKFTSEHFVRLNYDSRVRGVPYTLVAAFLTTVIYSGWIFATADKVEWQTFEYPQVSDYSPMVEKDSTNAKTDDVVDDSTDAPPVSGQALALTPSSSLSFSEVSKPKEGKADAILTGRITYPIVLHATGEVWVRVETSTGDVLLNDFLSAGEYFVVSMSDLPAFFSTQDAGALVLEVAGRRLGPAGVVGQIIIDYPLGYDELRTAYPELRKDS